MMNDYLVEGEGDNCEKSNKTLHKVITCGKQELWCAKNTRGQEGQ
jgi:hypothetical protein